jgi:hypothetical protein
MISLKSIIICGALLLPQQKYTKNWEGSDLPGHSYAKFDHFSGKQTFTIKLDQQGDFVFKYKTNLDKGSLQLEI